MTTEPALPPPGTAPAPAEPPRPHAAPAEPPAAETPAAESPFAAPQFTTEPPSDAPTPELLPPAPERAPRAPRRPRPVLLAVSGLVLGTLVGGGVGYAVQAQRPPTPLPPIQVARPSYPAVAVDPTAYAAQQPKPLAIDGDLRKLLIGAPDGSTAWGEFPDKPSWVSVGELAEYSDSAVRDFKDLNSRGFRRAAEVDWKKGDARYRVSLVQYAPDHADEAATHAVGTTRNLKPFADGANGANGANGGYRVDEEPRYWADSADRYYYGQAVAQRGTVAMVVEVFDSKPVNPDVVKDLAKQQWERLV
ncbi:hypothetical protein ACFVTF_20560 [Kitasatospora sp. NPDC057940]|uniref:hypothetical protein n=1 Tax=Kitasatospora sp. NPDC057940 TaxID=3346285 RepID=UPI0036DC1525